MSSEPTFYRDRLGRRMTIIEVPKPDAPAAQVERLHTHVRRLGKKGYRTQHSHGVNPDIPEHMHPEEPDVA